MNIQLSRVAMSIFVVVAIALLPGPSWAIYYGLGQSNDEWGLKYDVEVNEADRDTLTVVFTLADEGRLKPFYSLELIAFSLQTDDRGGRSYDVKAPIEFKSTKDGRRMGQVPLRKEFANRAQIRILTNMVDGKPQTSGLVYYVIPINKFLNKTPAAASSAATSPLAPPAIAAPPGSNVKR